MRVSNSWLKELVDLKISSDELAKLIPLRVQGGIKEVTDEYFELDLKGYNRADLLSLRGVALEVAAITDSKLLFEEPEEGKFAWDEIKLPSTPVSIDDPELATLQCVAKIEGLKVRTSPKEWVKKLADNGMRSVNNIADITNLVMLEYGQPLHSFDASSVKNETINVRLAKQNEEITTLDGKLRKLESTDIVLADIKEPLDVAGVMGGKDTEIKNSTITILLSASLFNPTMVRKTAGRLGLHSEASKRFQHGLTKKRLLQALDAAIKMYQDLGGKLTGISINGDLKEEPKKVKLTLQKVNSLTGIGLKPEEIENYLKKLGFTLASQGVPLGAWEVTVPYWRLDINLEEDLIEEVARMYGYEKIPAKELTGKNPEKIDQSLFQLISSLKTNLVNSGLHEVQTYSFYSTTTLKSMGWYEDNNLQYLVKVANPISAETEYLRMNLWPNLVEAVDRNIRQGLDDIAIFEVGKIFEQGKEESNEKYRLAIALMNNTDNPIEELLKIAHKMAKDLGWEIKENELEGIALTLFHPTRHTAIFKNGTQIGGLAEVHPKLLNKFGVEKRVAILEIDLP